MKIRILNKQPLRLYAKLGVVFGRINNPNVIIDSQEESNSIHYGGAADLQVIKPTIVDGVVFSLSSEHDLNSDYNSRVSVQFDVKGIATPEYHYGGMADSNSFNADLMLSEMQFIAYRLATYFNLQFHTFNIFS